MQNENNTQARTPKPQPKLAEMIKGQVFDGFLLVRSCTQRTSSNGSKYLDFQLCDVSAEVNGKMWDGTIALLLSPYLAHRPVAVPHPIHPAGVPILPSAGCHLRSSWLPELPHCGWS